MTVVRLALQNNKASTNERLHTWPSDMASPMARIAAWGIGGPASASPYRRYIPAARQRHPMRRLRFGRCLRPESGVSVSANNNRSSVKHASWTMLLVLIGARSERNSSKFSPVHGSVSKGPISDFPLRRHFREHWLVRIDIVVNDNVAFRRV